MRSRKILADQLSPAALGVNALRSAVLYNAIIFILDFFEELLFFFFNVLFVLSKED